MKNMKILFGVLAVVMGPEIALAAGTYYNGNYKSPQQNYATRQNASYSRDTTYTRTRTGVVPNANVYVGQQYAEYNGQNVMQGKNAKSIQKPTQKQNDTGLFLNAGVSHEFAAWKIDMNSAGSKLHYDNIRWNVFNVMAGYKFFAGNAPMQIDVGGSYGMQWGESSMIDDDLSDGGYLVTEWYDGATEELIGSQVGHSLSIGTSSDGNLLGFYAGFGMTDLFKLGGARITPSVGYRYFKHKLETKRDYGLTVDTGACVSGNDGETQCDPIIVIHYPGTSDNPAGAQQVIWNPEVNQNTGFWEVASGGATVEIDGISPGGTYMFALAGTSHSYETTWAGPYVALDLNYDINAYNLINARAEFGLPMYTSTGDQPYRNDWQHPKSVEDKGGFGDAWHFGFLMNYMTALSEHVYLSLGMTFDYYSLSKGRANTYLNSAYYDAWYQKIVDRYESLYPDLDEDDIVAYIDEYDDEARLINEIKSECKGWVCRVDNEIESVYKSMGIRVGIQAKF